MNKYLLFFKNYKKNKQRWKRGIFWRLLFPILAIKGIFCSLLYVLSEKDYLFIKTIHIIFVICWMAGILYLPRIFVYHCNSKKGSIQSEIFKVMEQRLLLYIANPAMVLTWSSGLWIAWNVYHFYGGWLYLKLGLVLLLTAFHVFLALAVHQFTNDNNQLSEKAWRILNEIPTLLMIVIVIAVVLKVPS